MKKEILLLKPYFRPMMWGGSALKDSFGYDLPSSNIGECWAISSREDGMTHVINGEFKGKNLAYLWNNHKEIFGNIEYNSFPLLTKILDANDDLSVQVHPDDRYAMINDNGSLGKNECWYIIDCKEDSEVVFGHNAQTKEELKEMIKSNQWNKLLRRVKIKPGDFLDVPSGTVHAICKGALILETQQNSDATYRLYDYDRIDDSGNKRQLHINKALDVIKTPHINVKTEPKVKKIDNGETITYISNEYFTLYKYNIFGKVRLTNDKPFLIVSVLDGEGVIDDQFIKKGDHFIIPSYYENFTLDGNLQLIVSHV